MSSELESDRAMVVNFRVTGVDGAGNYETETESPSSTYPQSVKIMFQVRASGSASRVARPASGGTVPREANRCQCQCRPSELPLAMADSESVLRTTDWPQAGRREGRRPSAKQTGSMERSLSGCGLVCLTTSRSHRVHASEQQPPATCRTTCCKRTDDATSGLS